MFTELVLQDELVELAEEGEDGDEDARMNVQELIAAKVSLERVCDDTGARRWCRVHTDTVHLSLPTASDHRRAFSGGAGN